VREKAMNRLSRYAYGIILALRAALFAQKH
jgi:hypothetical protein